MEPDDYQDRPSRRQSLVIALAVAALIVLVLAVGIVVGP